MCQCSYLSIIILALLIVVYWPVLCERYHLKPNLRSRERFIALQHGGACGMFGGSDEKVGFQEIGIGKLHKLEAHPVQELPNLRF